MPGDADTGELCGRLEQVVAVAARAQPPLHRLGWQHTAVEQVFDAKRTARACGAVLKAVVAEATLRGHRLAAGT